MTYFIYDEMGFIWAVYDDMFTMLHDYIKLLETGQEWHYDAVTFDSRLLGKWATFTGVYNSDIVQ